MQDAARRSPAGNRRNVGGRERTAHDPGACQIRRRDPGAANRASPGMVTGKQPHEQGRPCRLNPGRSRCSNRLLKKDFERTARRKSF
ncbi:hypothetical protein Pden_2038 [Paracoccus denitrificans PD1222]|uniref:Uncharacterized protein n=1 Tax=Paracoccus denitrificans (strain Pd 1222) TaxID=318586 RepID=A1B3N6_PARDP|nr:hypothetical protein Pden_2038 [Paracoccus denitrificans PD1222]